MLAQITTSSSVAHLVSKYPDPQLVSQTLIGLDFYFYYYYWPIDLGKHIPPEKQSLPTFFHFQVTSEVICAMPFATASYMMHIISQLICGIYLERSHRIGPAAP